MEYKLIDYHTSFALSASSDRFFTSSYISFLYLGTINETDKTFPRYTEAISLIFVIGIYTMHNGKRALVPMCKYRIHKYTSKTYRLNMIKKTKN